MDGNIREALETRYEYKIIQGGKKPNHPPTEYGITPISLRRQSVDPSHFRDVEDRKVLSK